MRNRKTALILSTALLSTVLLALPAFAHAQDAASQETIVTVTREPLPISRLGQSVNVLTDADIKSYQSLSVADLLVHATDMSLVRNGGPGQPATLSLRGAGGDHSLYILDGVRLNDPSQVGGGTNIGVISTDDASRIEVLRGPLSTLWGSGAMGGVISITSRQPIEKLEGDLRIEGLDRYGSARLGLGGKFGGLSWRVFGSTLNDQGISAAAAGTEKDSFSQTSLSAKARYDFNDSLSLKAYSGKTHNRVDFDGSAFVPPYNPIDSSDFGKTDTTLSVLALTHRFHGGEQTLSVSQTESERENFDGFNPANFTARGQIEQADYHISYGLGERTHLLGGLSFERDTMRTASSYSPTVLHADSDLSSVYGQIAHDFGPASVTFSARHDDASSFGAHDIAQLSLVAPINDRLRLRASAGQGVKVPSLYQLYSEYGTATLETEQSTTLDAGGDYSFAGGVFSATLFTRSVRNQIDFVYSGCIVAQIYGCYDNADRTQSRGVELELTRDLTDNLRLTSNYTFLNTENLSAGYEGNRLARTPKQMANADLAYTVNTKLQLATSARYVGERFDDNSNVTTLKAYTLIDLRADYALNDRLNLFGRIENAANTRYQTAAGYAQTGRRIWIGLHTRLF